MVYNANKRELEYIFARKLFKKHIFHNDNIEEEYYWDDYDTTYGYKMNTLANCLSPKQIPPLKKKHTTCLPRPPVVKILLSNLSTQTIPLVCNAASTQTNKSDCDASSQTFPKFYFPSHRFNLNVEPFNRFVFNQHTNIIL